VSDLHKEFSKWMLTTKQPYIGKKKIWQQLFQ